MPRLRAYLVHNECAQFLHRQSIVLHIVTMIYVEAKKDIWQYVRYVVLIIGNIELMHIVANGCQLSGSMELIVAPANETIFVAVTFI